jgi:hypothetical protein
MIPNPQRATLPLVRPPTTRVVDVGGHRIVLTVWTVEQWAKLREAERPDDAIPVEGLCWIAFRPAP